MKKSSFIVAIALTVAWSTVAPLTTPVSAQDDFSAVYGMDSTTGFNVLTNSMLTNQAFDRQFKNYYAERSKGRGGRGSRTVRGSGSRTALRGSTRFRPSLVARQRTLATIVAKARATNPQGAAALQRDFAKGDPIVAIAPALARYGLRTDDVADAMAAYLVSAWYGVRGSNQNPSRSSLRATRDQMRQVLLSNPAFASSSNATKQQMSDVLLLQTMVTDRLLTSAKGKPAQMARTQRAIRQGAFNTFKLDLSKMKLTASGLRS